MGGLFGGSKIDTTAADKQAAELAKKEKRQAAELAARRRASAGGGRSKTLFNSVLGIDNAIEQKVKLGG